MVAVLEELHRQSDELCIHVECHLESMDKNYGEMGQCLIKVNQFCP